MVQRRPRPWQRDLHREQQPGHGDGVRGRVHARDRRRWPLPDHGGHRAAPAVLARIKLGRAMTSDPRSLIDALEDQRERLVALALSVPPELRRTPFVGKWSLHELIAHLIGWDRTNINTVDE